MPKNQMERTTNKKKMKNSVPSDLTVMGLSVILLVCGWLFNINVNMHRYYEKLNIQLHYFTNTLKLNVFRYIKDIIKMYHDFYS